MNDTALLNRPATDVPPGRSDRSAIIDIGSNSIRLVVYGGPRRIPATLFNEKVMAGLGRSLDATGAIPPASIDAAIRALARFKRLTDTMGIERLRVIDTGLDIVTAEREQWDDGNNTLAVAPGLVVAYERNVETNERLEEAGVEVLRIAGSELGSGRGGPRCMSCPIDRAPLV